MFHYHIRSWKVIHSAEESQCVFVQLLREQHKFALLLCCMDDITEKQTFFLFCASCWFPPPTLERWQAYTRTSIIIQHIKNACRRIITETWRARANPKYFTLYDCLARLSLRLPLTLTKCNARVKVNKKTSRAHKYIAFKPNGGKIHCYLCLS